MEFEDGRIFTFCWKIVNLSFCSLETGEKLTSPEFSAEVLNKTSWYLCLYPKGANNLCGDYMSCFLYKKDDGENNASISYKLEAIASNGQILQSRKGIDEQVVKGRGAGSFNFLKRKHLLDSEINENDTLTIRCHLFKHDFQEQVVKCEARSEIQMEHFSFKWKIQIPDVPNCSRKISALYQESTQFDVILTSSSDKIHVYIRKSTGPTKLYKLKMTVFDECGDKLKLENDTHLFKPENNPLVYSTYIDTTLMQVETSGDSLYFSFLIKCDISSPCGSVLSAIESYDFENFSETYLRSKVRPNFQDNLRDMLLKEKHCDVKLQAGEKIISVHKSILSVRSPVFSAMFDQDMAENRTGVVDIQEVESEVLQSFLDFLYTDTFNHSDYGHVLKLLLVADRYQVPSLKERCSPFLMSNLTVENVREVIYVADLINHQNLKMFALDYIQANKTKIIQSRDWSEWVEKNKNLAIQILTKLSIN